MQAQNTTESYGWVMMLVHWFMAILIVGMIILGLYMVSLPIGRLKLKLYGWHKEWGLFILGLVTFRLIWRWLNQLPTLPVNMPRIEIFAARFVHYLFYILMFLVPLSGWLMSSAAGLPVSFFGLFTMPDLVIANEQSRVFFEDAHELLAYVLLGCIVLHMLAALKHHFINKDDVMRKMLP